MNRQAFFFVAAMALGSATAAIACGSDERIVYVEVPGEAGSPLPVPTGPPTPIFTPDASEIDASDGGFQSCAGTAIEAKREKLPVDIVFMVDNSASMAPAVAEVQAGINGFASFIGGRGLDYRVVMLSLRGTSPVSVGGSTRYPICVPPPLGGAGCTNTPLFLHAAVDVLSTQIFEQLLGTLDQTTGYAQGGARGGEPWAQHLRKEATKSIVVVSDDNSRFPAVSFEGFPGGTNPYTNGFVLPVGLLHPSRNGAWKGYSFNGIYGWGSTADPSIRCTYSDGSRPAASGSEYSALVAKTNGVRAQLCAGPAGWGPFFDSVATAVIANARVACELPVPVPEAGILDTELVNVVVTGGDGKRRTVPRVATEADCGAAEGWYYDNPTSPTKVHLCTAACDAAQSPSGATLPPKVEVLLGCKSVVR